MLGMTTVTILPETTAVTTVSLPAVTRETTSKSLGTTRVIFKGSPELAGAEPHSRKPSWTSAP